MSLHTMSVLLWLAMEVGEPASGNVRVPEKIPNRDFHCYFFRR
jgi:hypothetical protein